MIRAIVFDCFGVLTTDVWRAFIDSLPPEADIQRARDLNHALDAGFIDREAFNKGVLEATGQVPEMVESLDGSTTKNQALLQYISGLKSRYKIGLLSNIASDWITRDFLTTDEQHLFDEMVLSFEVGLTKPDPRIFALVCERLGMPPSEVVLIDDIASYCDAAKAAGLGAIVYTSFRQCTQDLEAILNHT